VNLKNFNVLDSLMETEIEFLTNVHYSLILDMAMIIYL
jgi:hypothetical protein